MQDLFDIIPALLKQFDDDAGLREKLVFAAWHRVSGEELRMRTVPVLLDGKRFVVAVEDETWKKNLETLSPQMIFKLNGALGQSVVSFIEFITDEEKVRLERLRNNVQEDETAELKKSAKKEVTEDLLKAASTIEDISLREKFLAAAGIALARKKTFTKQ